MNLKGKVNKIIIAFTLVVLVGVVAIGGSFLLKPEIPNSQKETSSNIEPGTEQLIEVSEELDEGEIEEEPDREEDEIYIEEPEDTEDTEDETDGDEDQSEKTRKNKKPYYIKINKALNTVTIYGLDDKGNYSSPVKAMVCSTGSVTPLGKYNTTAKYTWKLLNGGVWGQYSTRITGSILFHSVPMKTKSKDAVYYSYYNRLGTRASAGCVRLTTIDAKWIFDNCPVGTTVEIYNDSSSPGPLGKPSALKLPTNIATGWDPTDPDPKNPWSSKLPSIVGASAKNIERGSEFNSKSGIKALDGIGNDITNQMVIEGSVNTKKIGDYKVTYTIKDSQGRTAKETVTYKVVDTRAPKITVAKDSSLIPRAKNIDEFLLGRISITDNGEQMDSGKTQISKTETNWGYNVTYKYTDQSGNLGSLDDQVLFDKSLKITVVNKLIDLEDSKNISSLDLKNVVTATLINNNTNKSDPIEASNSGYSTKIIGDNGKVITVEFNFKYATPLGEKTVKDLVDIGYTLYVEETEEPGADTGVDNPAGD